MSRKPHRTKIPAPFLKRLSLRPEIMAEEKDYPFNLPWLRDGSFELEFDAPVTIFAGENGSGKSTLLEAIADLAGYDSAGGGKSYRAVDHSNAIDVSGAGLSKAFRASWFPKLTTGWFFRAETFFSVARYLDSVQSPSADYLSWSHGEGFVRFFEERLSRQGIYFLDEPESALSPSRQIELLRILHRVQESATSQVIMATHSPVLMALPGATLLEFTPRGPVSTNFKETKHFRLYRDFVSSPEEFIGAALKVESGED